ncbi:hypothetical protein HDV05_002728 [Chytridiales sp. JEL 0842]|nr:hypothetical protein HDV05_002728 [Chytridiales sp. JEL 0842]
MPQSWISLCAALLFLICTIQHSTALPVSTDNSTSATATTDFIRFANTYGSYMVLQQAPSDIILWGVYKHDSSPTPPTIQLTSTAESHANQTFMAETTPLTGNFSFRTDKVDDWSNPIYTVLPNTQNLKRWIVRLPPLQAALDKEYAFTVSMGSLSDKIEHVLVGDVWVCSGQSNMQMSLENTFGGNDAIDETLTNFNNNIRLFGSLQNSISDPVQEIVEVALKWSQATPESLRSIYTWNHFSGLCYYYGKSLQKERNYPIGLIQAAYGGTYIRSYFPSTSGPQTACEPDQVPPTPANPSFRNNPTVIWNAMLEPFSYTPIFGVLWYQGETDSNTAAAARSYACRFPALIQSWRETWFDRTSGSTDPLFPFGFVQLSTWGNDLPLPCLSQVPDVNGTMVPADYTSECTVPTVRWSQTANYGYVPNPAMPKTFMAISMDYGDPDIGFFTDIHSRHKKPIAERLVKGALDVAYNIPNTSTLWQSTRPLKTVGVPSSTDSVLLTFSQSGLIKRSSLGFELCTRTQSICTQANFTVGPSGDSVFLTPTNNTALPRSEKVGVVRYNWARTACEPQKGVLGCAVYTGSEVEGLIPVGPFKLDVGWDTEAEV